MAPNFVLVLLRHAQHHTLPVPSWMHAPSPSRLQTQTQKSRRCTQPAACAADHKCMRVCMRACMYMRACIHASPCAHLQTPCCVEGRLVLRHFVLETNPRGMCHLRSSQARWQQGRRATERAGSREQVDHLGEQVHKKWQQGAVGVLGIRSACIWLMSSTCVWLVP